MELNDIETILPLSPAQEDVVHRGAGAECGQLTCELHSVLDVDALLRAWEHVAERHQLLRALLVSRRLIKPLLVVRHEVSESREPFGGDRGIEDDLNQPEKTIIFDNHNRTGRRHRA